jgi:hypothetical protein
VLVPQILARRSLVRHRRCRSVGVIAFRPTGLRPTFHTLHVLDTVYLFCRRYQPAPEAASATARRRPRKQTAPARKRSRGRSEAIGMAALRGDVDCACRAPDDGITTVESPALARSRCCGRAPAPGRIRMTTRSLMAKRASPLTMQSEGRSSPACAAQGKSKFPGGFACSGSPWEDASLFVDLIISGRVVCLADKSISKWSAAQHADFALAGTVSFATA